MPFTLSHSALVLPFLKNKKLSATALIVGSMSPDFEYFFRMRMQSEISHTFWGIFLIDFPLGLIVMFAFHEIIKKPLIANLPPFLQQRLRELKQFDWVAYFKSNVVVVLTSFFLGTVSHILWDSFTHWDGYFVQRLPFFNVEIYTIPIYKIAQHLSSIVGLLLICFYILNLPVDNQEIRKINLNYWTITVIFSIALISLRFYFGSELNQIGNAIVSIITPIAIAFALSGIVFGKKTII